MNTARKCNFGLTIGRIMTMFLLVAMVGSIDVATVSAREGHDRGEDHDNGRYERNRGHEYERNHYDRRNRRVYRSYEYRERVYVPPPVFYAPPPPPGISFFLPSITIRP